MMTPGERAEYENLQHRHMVLTEEHRQLQRERDELAKRYAALVASRSHAVARHAPLEPGAF